MGDPHLSVNLFVASPLWKRNFAPAWAIPYRLMRIKNSAAACRLPCLPWRIAWVRVVKNLSQAWRRESSSRVTIWQSSAWVLCVMKPCPRRLGALFLAFFRTGWHEGGIWARGNYALWRNNTGSKGQIWPRFAGHSSQLRDQCRGCFGMRCWIRPMGLPKTDPIVPGFRLGHDWFGNCMVSRQNWVYLMGFPLVI